MVFTNIPLRSKVIGLAILLLALLTVQGALALGGKPGTGVTVVVLVVGYVVGGSVTLVTVRRLSHGARQVVDRMDAIEEAAKGNLMRGLEALADGDLTVELHAKTAAASNFDGDEVGEIMRHAELFRDAMVGCYDSYNRTTKKLRELVGQVSDTAGSVSAASQQMSSTSEEAGKATGEIAQAINDVAEGAERQARMVEEAQRAAQEIANAVAESAENAERTAEVANSAHDAAQQGVDAAEKANDAMQWSGTRAMR